jgi:hypothetical protein
MSFGVLLSGEWGLKPIEELLHEVDTALYAAKSAGRNCLKIAHPAKFEELPSSAVPETVRHRH